MFSIQRSIDILCVVSVQGMHTCYICINVFTCSTNCMIHYYTCTAEPGSLELGVCGSPMEWAGLLFASNSLSYS